MIPLKLIEANNFRLQEKTYKKYMKYNWVVHCLPSFLKCSMGMSPQLTVQGVQLKIRNLKNLLLAVFPLMGLSGGVETKRKQ